MNSFNPSDATNNPPRELHEGMGQAVAERTILRKKEDGSLENWGDVAARVALGNSLLCDDPVESVSERRKLERHIGTQRC